MFGVAVLAMRVDSLSAGRGGGREQTRNSKTSDIFASSKNLGLAPPTGNS